MPVDGWERVALADGRAGFVATRYLRSPLGFRAQFTFDGDRWWLTVLVTGD